MNGQGTKFIVAVMDALLLVGCSYNLSEIREYEPYRTLTSAKPPKVVAKCIEFQIRKYISLLTVALEEHPDQSYRIALSNAIEGAIVDILVKPSGSGSKVEVRTKPALMRKGHMLGIIDACAR